MVEAKKIDGLVLKSICCSSEEVTPIVRDLILSSRHPGTCTHGMHSHIHSHMTMNQTRAKRVLINSQNERTLKMLREKVQLKKSHCISLYENFRTDMSKGMDVIDF